MARVLLINSDKIVADNICHFLSRAGYQVDWHLEPQAAVDGADAKAPDAIITDLVFAGRSGAEFLYEFRSYPEWQNLPVIILADIRPEEFSDAGSGFGQLNVAAYHYLPITKLTDLVKFLDMALSPAAA